MTGAPVKARQGETVMPARIALALILVLTTGLAALARPAAQPNPMAQGNNAFALDLYNQIRKAQPGNIFFSPYSLRSALALCYAGARGEVAQAMAKALRFPDDQAKMNQAYGSLTEYLLEAGNTEQQRLAIANALWVHKAINLLKPYQEAAAKYYRAKVANLDFGNEPAARETINAWVAEQTRQMIKDLIPPGLLSPGTPLVITNAIFFLGKWQSPFKPANTSDQFFFLDQGGQVKTPLMQRTASYDYAADNLCQAVDLPYRDGKLSMLVLLPHHNVKLSQLEAQLDPKRLQGLLSRMRYEKVDLSLPRFKSASSLRLDSALRSLGLDKAFGVADFAGITGKPDLVIGAVLHKARVEVEETGTKAAAATAAVVAATAMPDPEMPEVFRADHPFLYLIRDQITGTILFMGRLTKPGEE